MAGIDKIYGTRKQYETLYDWLLFYKPDYLQYLYEYDSWETHAWKKRAIANFPSECDTWLLKNCHIPFVQRRLKEQYGLN